MSGCVWYVQCVCWVDGVALGVGYVYVGGGGEGMQVFGGVFWRVFSVCAWVLGMGMRVGIGFVCV